MRHPTFSRWYSSYLYGASKIPIRNALITFPIENRARLSITLSFSVFYCKTFLGQLTAEVLQLRFPLSHGTRRGLPLPSVQAGAHSAACTGNLPRAPVGALGHSRPGKPRAVPPARPGRALTAAPRAGPGGTAPSIESSQWRCAVRRAGQ